MADPRFKQLTIKTGVVKRLTKEKTVYEREVEAQKSRIERLRGEGSDEHVLRKENEVLDECIMMIPDCQRRLAKAYDDLVQYLLAEAELSESKEYVNAQLAVDAAKPELPASYEF